MQHDESIAHSKSSAEKTGVLITNLGSPAAATTSAVRKYLKQFLSDPRVVEIPRWIWWPILHGIILPIRPAKSAKLYQKIWGKNGSPLMQHTVEQCDAIKQKLIQQSSSAQQKQIIVRYAMRYGEPSIESAIKQLQAEGANKITVLPLYPQYSSATTGSTFDAIAKFLTKMRSLPSLNFISHYHDNPQYIQACALQIRQCWQQNGRSEKIIFSYHGLPQSTIDKGDPYYSQCTNTTRLLAKALELTESQYLQTFQSRFGKAEWLKPYTSKTLQTLPSQGINSVDIFCPGFSADCLETLEEIVVENKHYFLEAGGKNYCYIPALNANDAHIDALTRIIQNAASD